MDMAQRTITDGSGRSWVCDEVRADTGTSGDLAPRQGSDVTLSCSTPSLPEPVTITVGWNWERMADNGLARLVSQAAQPTRE
jgi:hypothetical protein